MGKLAFYRENSRFILKGCKIDRGITILIQVGFKRLTEDAILPVKAHPTDSGFDLFANESVTIYAGETKVIKTGVAVKLPPGYEAQVRPRSGVTSKTKLRVQIGTIDNDYTGEIGIITDCISGAPIEINKGDKLAQLVIASRPAIETYEFTEEFETVRGNNGFGSTGY